MADLDQHAAELEAYAGRILKAITPEVTARCMEQVGQAARLIIYKRTVEDGQDADGMQFEAYSTRRMEVTPDSPYFAMVQGAGRRYRLRRGERDAGKGAAFGFGDAKVKRRASRRGERALRGSVFDAGWAQLKQLVGGHGGQRDMVMRGDMMGQAANPGFAVVSSGAERVVIDFLNAKERLKAKGLHERFNWWGVGRLQAERDNLTAAFMDAWRPYLAGGEP